MTFQLKIIGDFIKSKLEHITIWFTDISAMLKFPEALVPANRRGSGDLSTSMPEGLLAVATGVSVPPLLGTSGGSVPV